MIKFDTRIISDIEAYCELNNIDPEKYANNLLRKSFTVDKYGETPFIQHQSVKIKELKDFIQEVVPSRVQEVEQIKVQDMNSVKVQEVKPIEIKEMNPVSKIEITKPADIPAKNERTTRKQREKKAIVDNGDNKKVIKRVAL